MKICSFNSILNLQLIKIMKWQFNKPEKSIYQQSWGLWSWWPVRYWMLPEKESFLQDNNWCPVLFRVLFWFLLFFLIIVLTKMLSNLKWPTANKNKQKTTSTSKKQPTLTWNYIKRTRNDLKLPRKGKKRPLVTCNK